MPNAQMLKKRMEDKNVTQSKLAEQLGLAQSTVCQKINGIRPFFLDEAEKVARILDISEKEFGSFFFAP